MNKIPSFRCMVVDDEPLGRQVMERYIKETDLLELCGSFPDVKSALENLNKHSIDLLFLDIKMPELNGFQFINKLSEPKPKIILITAYSEFALQAFEYGVSDYLMKPISYSRFKKSIQQTLYAPSRALKEEAFIQENFQYFKSGHRLQKIDLDSIDYFEAFGNFTKIHYGDETLLASESLSAIFSKLPQHFARIHKSFVINLQKINTVTPRSVLINSTELPIGTTYKKVFNEKFRH